MNVEYWLQYEYGIHHIWIQVSKDSFNSVVDKISEEFCIHQEFDDQETPSGLVKTILVFFYNYYDEPFVLGKIVEFVEG